jgi:hypothetical protein
VPWVWVRIVRASTELTMVAKVVYDEIRGLATGRGATIGAAALAARLGISIETVERTRRDLVAFGLLIKVDLGLGRAAGWFPTLPASCRPPERCRRLSDDDVQERARALDERIRLERARGGVMRGASRDSEPASDPEIRDATLASAMTPVARRNA